MKFGDYRDLLVYQKAFNLAMDIFQISINFSKEEKYSLTDQMRRLSRSVCANLAEAYRKRVYPKHFFAKLTDCMGENSETQLWMDFSLNCKYINETDYKDIKN